MAWNSAYKSIFMSPTRKKPPGVDIWNIAKIKVNVRFFSILNHSGTQIHKNAYILFSVKKGTRLMALFIATIPKMWLIDLIFREKFQVSCWMEQNRKILDWCVSLSFIYLHIYVINAVLCECLESFCGITHWLWEWKIFLIVEFLAHFWKLVFKKVA